jgi:hypothetical protein
MTTTTTTRATSGAPLREVGEGPAVAGPRASVFVVVAVVVALVLLPFAQVVPPAGVLVAVVLWAILRVGVPVRSI